MIVVDSNVIAARNLTGMLTELSGLLEKKDPVWIVPPLWRYEFQNILVQTVRARQITCAQSLSLWRTTFAQMLKNEQEPNPVKVLDLSCRYQITGYDANFIALAMDMDIPCITEDRELQVKFPGIAFGMATFLNQPAQTWQVQETQATYRAKKPRRQSRVAP